MYISIIHIIEHKYESADPLGMILCSIPEVHEILEMGPRSSDGHRVVVVNVVYTFLCRLCQHASFRIGGTRTSVNEFMFYDFNMIFVILFQTYSGELS